MIKLYTSKQCVHCPGAKQKLNAEGLGYVIVDIDSPEGLQDARDNGVRGLPTVIAINPLHEVLELVGDKVDAITIKHHMGIYD